MDSFIDKNKKEEEEKKSSVCFRDDYFRFSLVFFKKSNQTDFFLKKIEISSKPISFGLVLFGQKPVQTGLA